MKHWLLLLCLVGGLVGQSPKRVEIPSCGFPSKTECHCISRTEKIQLAATELCRTGDWRNYYKTQSECFADRILNRYSHCNIAETWVEEYDEPNGITQQDGHSVTSSTMGTMCSMACLKHDCKCAQDTATPVCHFGHTARDHEK